MASALAWLDHDTTARDRTKRILALFSERGTVDQLGLGGIRDSFADLMFPGTSTIQTRLRYFMFVPWIYKWLEEDEVSSLRFGPRAREHELALTAPLLSKEEEGVFGKTAGNNLKRLPSEVYWGGLGSWGIRRFDASRDVYHRAVDDLYRRRKSARRSPAEGTESEAGIITWHSELPSPPAGFPDDIDLKVTSEEADFLRDRISAEHPDTLLNWLVLHPIPTAVDYVWNHPLASQFSADHQHIIQQARLFSVVMHGAAILFNIMLSDEADLTDFMQYYRDLYDKWLAELKTDEVQRWDLDELFDAARKKGSHSITPQAEDFVRRWVAFVRADAAAIPQHPQRRSLVKNREMALKGKQSFFRNRRMLEEKYRGDRGMVRLNYRWFQVQRLLNDLNAGLGSGRR
jgi:hypothetical protein